MGKRHGDIMKLRILRCKRITLLQRQGSQQKRGMSMRFRQVHLDFHTSGRIPDIGGRFSKEQFQAALKVGHVDSITVFSKCHHGWAYHPSKANRMHPHLKFDLLGAQQTQRSEKQEKLEQAMDAIRGKYGKDAIAFGSNGGKQVGWDD